MTIRFLIILILLWLPINTTISSTRHPDKINFLPGYGAIKDQQFSGYLPLSSTNHSDKLFYWLVENRSHATNAPLVLWLNGGPGTSSLYGFLLEHGPYFANPNGTLTKRKYSWNTYADYLVIDQPAGVGFSYGTNKSFKDEEEAIDQLHYAIKIFFERHPELSSKPFYLAGQSYAGKYLPKLAIKILNDNNNHIKLQGILVGDPWVNPKLQQSANAAFAYSHGLIEKSDIDILNLYEKCAKEINKATPSSHVANQICVKMMEFIQQRSHVSLLNINAANEPDTRFMTHYLNQPAVRKALHVDSRIDKFTTSNSDVLSHLEVGTQDSAADLYPILLAKGIRIWIYNGLEDATDSNFMGTDLWLANLNWPGKKAFLATHHCIWKVNNNIAGYSRSTAGLTQIKIRNAGHIAPADKPAELFDLFNHFINNEQLCDNQIT